MGLLGRRLSVNRTAQEKATQNVVGSRFLVRS